jgi:hypothetical protein
MLQIQSAEAAGGGGIACGGALARRRQRCKQLYWGTPDDDWPHIDD